MNTHSPGSGRDAPDPGADERRFDAALRGLHAQALEQVSPQVRARLRTIRHQAAAPARTRGAWAGWALASGGVAALALAASLQFAGGPAPAPAAQSPALAVTEAAPASGAVPAEVGYDPDTAVAALEENPDFYLWLASNSDALPTYPE